MKIPPSPARVNTPLALLVMLTALLQCTGVYAEPERAVSVGVSPAYLIKTVAALCFVLLAIFLLSKLLRSVNAGGKLSNGPIKVLAGANVGSRERLVIVQAGDSQMLLGISPAGIVKLEKFDKPVVVSDEASGMTFKQQFGHLIRTQKS